MSETKSSARKRARELLAEATPGPWSCWDIAYKRGEARRAEYFISPADDTAALLADVRGQADGRLMASAPTLLAALCDELDGAEARIAALEKALRATSAELPDVAAPPTGDEFGGLSETNRFPVKP